MCADLNRDSLDLTERDADLLAFNQAMIGGLVGAGWAFPPESAQALRDQLAASTPPEHLYFSARAEMLDVPSGAGSVPVRVFRPSGEPAAIYVHCHGGGFTIGSALGQDASLERIVDASGVVVVSVDYRLAPEHPYPAGLEDCETVLRWALSNGSAVFGTDRAIIGGESAGANLALCALLRVQATDPGAVVAANLLYGNYDLTMTPSQRAGESRMITPESLRWFYEQYLPGDDDRDHPDKSPLYANLTGLPPIQLAVGNEDAMLDDSLFLATRLLAAGVDCRLVVVPGAEHAFDTAPLPTAQAVVAQLDRFVAQHAVGA